MSVVANLSVPASEFALADALSAAPQVHVEFERIVTHGQEWIMPFLWASGEDLPAFDRAVHDDPTVDSAAVAQEFEEVLLYRFQWSDAVVRSVNAIFDQEGTLVEATGSDGEWELQVRFEERHSLSVLQSHFDDADAGFAVERVYTPSEPRQSGADVTPAQRDALVAALDDGYFDVPRGTTMAEVADRLGVSQNAASERLRRGTANLVAATLTVRDSAGVDGRD